MNSVLLLSRDLFFSSKVTGAASMVGAAVEVVGTVDAVLERVSAGGVRCLLIDLSNAALDVASLLSKLPTDNRPRVIAFGAHVATARLDAARAAGCDEVLTRGRFDTMLPELLRQYAQP